MTNLKGEWIPGNQGRSKQRVNTCPVSLRTSVTMKTRSVKPEFLRLRLWPQRQLKTGAVPCRGSFPAGCISSASAQSEWAVGSQAHTLLISSYLFASPTAWMQDCSQTTPSAPGLAPWQKAISCSLHTRYRALCSMTRFYLSELPLGAPHCNLGACSVLRCSCRDISPPVIMMPPLDSESL